MSHSKDNQTGAPYRIMVISTVLRQLAARRKASIDQTTYEDELLLEIERHSCRAVGACQ